MSDAPAFSNAPMPRTLREFGAYLVNLRTAVYLSLNEAAERAHVAPRTLRDIEAGRRPAVRESTLIALAIAYDAEPEQLITLYQEVRRPPASVGEAIAQAPEPLEDGWRAPHLPGDLTLVPLPVTPLVERRLGYEADSRYVAFWWDHLRNTLAWQDNEGIRAHRGHAYSFGGAQVWLDNQKRREWRELLPALERDELHEPLNLGGDDKRALHAALLDRHSRTWYLGRKTLIEAVLVFFSVLLLANLACLAGAIDTHLLCAHSVFDALQDGAT